MIRVWSFEEAEEDLPGRVLWPLLLLLLLLLLPILVLLRAPGLSSSEGDAVMERRWNICRRTGIGIIHKVSFSCRSGSVVGDEGWFATPQMARTLRQHFLVRFKSLDIVILYYN